MRDSGGRTSPPSGLFGSRLAGGVDRDPHDAPRPDSTAGPCGPESIDRGSATSDRCRPGPVNPFVEGNVAAPTHLPQAGDPREDAEPPHQPAFIEVVHIPQGHRARADQRHITAQDVPELGSSSSEVTPENGSKASDARVPLDLEDRPLGLVHAPDSPVGLRHRPPSCETCTS